MGLDRRGFLTLCSRAGVAGTLLPGVLFTLAAQGEAVKVTPELIDEAAAMAGVTLTGEQRTMMLGQVEDQRSGYAEIRALKIPNSVAPAYVFDPLPPGAVVETGKRAARISAAPAVAAPAKVEELAFATVRELAELVRTRRVTSLALTEMYLARLKRYDPMLHFVITLTEERALAQARAF